GHITGLEGVSTERTLELIPSLTLAETGRRVRSVPPALLAPGQPDLGRFVNEPLKFDPGLTAKLGITPTITLDLAVNPDFAQVEADQTVITANQRFPIFFEEKRPFFLEGIDIFRTPISAVHTRAIVDPDLAVKLTGKRGRNTFGLMVASDNGPGNITGDDRLDPVNFHFLDRNAFVGVLRLKRDVGKDSTVGFLATSYNFRAKDGELTDYDIARADPCSAQKSLEKTNQLAGFDGRFRVNKTTTLEFQALGTTSTRCFFDADAGRSLFQTRKGFAYEFSLNDNGRNFGYNFSAVARTRDFRSDVGFNRRTNTHNYNLFVRYNSTPKPKAKMISWRVFTSPQTNFDWQGRMQRWNNNTQLTMNFRRQSFIGIGGQEGYERVFEEEFGAKRKGNCAVQNNCTFAGEDSERSAGYHNFYAYGGTTPTKKYSLFLLAVREWGVMDFDFGAGSKFPRVSPVAIRAREAGGQGLCGRSPLPAVCNSPLDPGAGKQWHIEANLNYKPTNSLSSSLSMTRERLVRNDTGRVAFDDMVVTWRTTYQFSRFTFARARLDYDSLRSNVRGQFLLGWAPNPGTAFYAGYNDDMNRNGFNPFTGDLEPGFRRNGRTFFVKMSYLFRKSL
ncbi:MAG TPA: DUF5916 domain-containing protein, partial [Pyrinomonadaceae bacterium]